MFSQDNHRYWDSELGTWYPLSQLKYIEYSVTGKELFYNYDDDAYFICNEHVYSDIYSFTKLVLTDGRASSISLPGILDFEVLDTIEAEEYFNLGELYTKFGILVPDVVAELAYENIASQGECKPVLFLYDATEASL
jgi:hypothetical protein